MQDEYSTSIGARYVEIACLVVGTRTTSVIVGAAPPGEWARMAGVIEPAIAAVRS